MNRAELDFLFGLNLFQLAAVSVVDSLSQRSDSTVAIRVVVSEGPPRVLTGFTGYTSEGGATGTAQWTHRNFFGGARSFTASLRAQTGVGAVGQYGEIDYEGRLSLRQPYLFDRRFSGTVEPFARYQDDIIERSAPSWTTIPSSVSAVTLSWLSLQPARATAHVQARIEVNRRMRAPSCARGSPV